MIPEMREGLRLTKPVMLQLFGLSAYLCYYISAKGYINVFIQLLACMVAFLGLAAMLSAFNKLVYESLVFAVLHGSICVYGSLLCAINNLQVYCRFKAFGLNLSANNQDTECPGEADHLDDVRNMSHSTMEFLVMLVFHTIFVLNFKSALACNVVSIVGLCILKWEMQVVDITEFSLICTLAIMCLSWRWDVEEQRQSCPASLAAREQVVGQEQGLHPHGTSPAHSNPQCQSRTNQSASDAPNIGSVQEPSQSEEISSSSMSEVSSSRSRRARSAPNYGDISRASRAWLAFLEESSATHAQDFEQSEESADNSIYSYSGVFRGLHL